TTEVYTVAFSPDGKRLASGSNREVKVWDAATGKEVFTYSIRGSNVYGLAFSPDGKLLALGISRDVKVLDAATGKELLWIKNGPNFLFRMAFSPDSKRLAVAAGLSGDKPGDIHIWDPNTGKEVMTLGGHTEAVLAVAYSADGKYLVSSSGGTTGTKQGEVRLWNAATGRPVRTFGGHTANIYAVSISPDGRRIASASGIRPSTGTGKGEIKVWEAATGSEALRLAGHAVSAYSVVFSPDGRLLASTAADGSLKFWDTLGGLEVRSVRAHNGVVYSVAFSPNGKQVATAGNDRTVKVWDMNFAAGPRPGQAPPGPKEVQALWSDLAGTDASRAYRAILTLSSAPAQAMPFLKARLRPVPVLTPPQQERLRKLVHDLDDRRFPIREKASRELTALGPAAVPALRQALDDRPSLEARRRLEQLLETLSGMTLSAEQLQALRAVAVLEHINTPEARRLLEALAGGLTTARLTEDAKTTLERLNRRSQLP
ncbi:MAG TPA: PQQ-binding-like beta-propeller repeat protein, partial [Gemmataceae bacterium]|nr:PQQ-binding-like beta-propeller repeat protein [Gemmataceae bacterium]